MNRFRTAIALNHAGLPRRLPGTCFVKKSASQPRKDGRIQL